MKYLNYMGPANALEVQQVVSRRLLDLINTCATAPRTEQQKCEFEHCERVLTACETIIDHLNGEYAAFCEARTPKRSDREVFNTP